MQGIERMSGRYQGMGSWYDAQGQSQSYTIDQTNRVTAGGFEIAVKHDFEDGTVIKATFSMTWITQVLFRLDMLGSSVGNGYYLEDYCHYHLQIGGGFVEASYRVHEHGIKVFGSSTKNAEGNYIAWHESLRKVSQSA
jgi:hypothetical protein